MPVKVGSYTINIRAVDRDELDSFFSRNPPPEPPTKTVEVFGGVPEEIPDPDNREYMNAVTCYYIRLAESQMPLLLRAIDSIEPETWRTDAALVELQRAGITEISEEAFVRFVVGDDGIQDIVDEIRYLSTTTERGIQEAEDAYNATWIGKPIHNWRVKRGRAGWSRIMEDREAARFAGVPWYIFSKLSGPEQSAIVAHYRTINYVQSLEMSSK